MKWITDRVGTTAMMQAMDRKAIEDYLVPGLVLMENAGRGAFEFILDEFDPARVTILAGKGNNGGDGYVIARHLINAGVEVETILLADPDDIKGDAKTNLDALTKMGGRIISARDIAALEDYRYYITRSDLIVDAILGVGFTGEVRGFYSQAISLINGLVQETPGLRVFAVDLPSGINADTGQVMGAAIAADATVTFGMIKTGQLSFPGARLVGTLALVDISIPRDLYNEVPYRIITRDAARELLPVRAEDCHKGAAGHGLVLAGSPGKTGAAIMAAEAALRTGAGLVTLAGPESLHRIFETKTLEVMTEPLPESDLGLLAEASVARARELMADKTAVALGPGLGRGAGVRRFVEEIIAGCGRPLVIDADGLNAVAEDVAMLKRKSGPVILTPHPGEMGRLVGKSADEVTADRLVIALDFARQLDVIVVLKGACSLIACPDGSAFFNPTGNPGLATGGTGDVLTGVILGLLCQGLESVRAAVLAVYLHGLAGDLAAEEMGEEGLIAGDVMRKVPAALMRLREPGAED